MFGTFKFCITSLLVISTSFFACATTQETVMKVPIAKLELPQNTVLLYENMVVSNVDRTGNYRFFFRDDGCFFNAHNTKLWVTNPDLIDSDDPALHWNTSFSKTPDRCLTESQRAELLQAIYQTNFPSLNKYYLAAPDERSSHPTIERWTVVNQGSIYTVVVETRKAPSLLIQLRKVINEVVDKAPRVKSSGIT